MEWYWNNAPEIESVSFYINSTNIIFLSNNLNLKPFRRFSLVNTILVNILKDPLSCHEIKFFRRISLLDPVGILPRTKPSFVNCSHNTNFIEWNDSYSVQ